MSNKVVIAKAGFNALTETDPNNLVFSSDYNTFKYHVSGSYNAVVPSSGSDFVQEYTIYTHNLGYIPFYTAFIKQVVADEYFNLPFYFADFGGYINIYLYATSTALILRYEASSSSGFDFDIWFKVFKNRVF